MSSESIREKICKLLMLSTSDNDPEALSAIRMANKLMKNSGLTWLVFIDIEPPRSKHQPEPETAFVVDEEDVYSIIDYIREHAWPNFDFSFVDSVEKNFDEYGKLTYRQQKALKNVLDSIKNKEE